MGKTGASRLEEDQNPLVQNSFRYNSLEGTNPPAQCCGLRRRTIYIISGVITIIILTLVITLAIVLTKIYPIISYSGNLTQYTDDIGANACGLPLLDDSAMISKSLFDHGLKGNTSSVCGHKIWVQGYGNDGTTVKGASLTLTVIGYCTDCGHGDLVAPGAYGALSEPPNGGYVDDDGVSVKWHWLKPIPKLHL